MAPSKNDLINQASDLQVKLQIAIDGLLELRKEVSSQAAKLSELGRKVASSDVLSAFAYHARKHSWNRPEIKHDSTMQIVSGRHPVLEGDGRFVPNLSLIHI